MDDQHSTLEIIEELLRFDTTSYNSNLPLIEYVTQYLEGFGIPLEIMQNAEGTKANLVACIGPEEAPAIVISGHTDVVPADPSQWAVTSPFEPRLEEGRLYGRGSADMKAFIGIALSKLAPLHIAPLRHAIILALSFDEELGCLGAPLMMPVMRQHAHRIRGCIIGEPTSMRVGYAHKGHMAARATVHGRGGHSGYPERGANAIDIAAELVGCLHRMGTKKREPDQLDMRFDPPYSTVHTGLISGGTALNKIPDECRLDFETRFLPRHDPEEILAQLGDFFTQGLSPSVQPTAEKSRLEIERRSQYPQLHETNESFIAWVSELSASNEPAVTLGFGSEAGLFAELGVPTVVCGPGSIHQAHLPDEYIELQQIRSAETFFDRLTRALEDGLPSFK